MPETVFHESVAKVAISFFSLIKIFENTAFGHVTEVPNLVPFHLQWRKTMLKGNKKSQSIL